MTRGKIPNRFRRARAENLRELMHDVRLARKNVLIAEGHALAHRAALDTAVERAYAAGATRRELIEAAGPAGRGHR